MFSLGREFLFVALSCVSFLAHSEELLIVGDPWCPFTCTAGGSKPGILVEVAQEIFLVKGHTVKYENINWARAIEETRAGRFHAVAGALKADAPDFVFPSRSTGSQKSCFFSKAGLTWNYQGVSSLKGHVLSVVNDYAYGGQLDAYIAQHREDAHSIDVLSGTGTSLKLLKKIVDSRSELMIDDATVIAYTLKNEKDFPIEQVRQAGCLDPVPLYIAFSPKNPKSKVYAQILSDGVRKLIASGRMAKIYERYGIQ